MARISIIGAGSVGSAAAYTLAVSGLAKEIKLIDINANRAMGEATDISHSVALSSPVDVSGGGYELLDGSDIIIMTAGAAQQPGENRRALAAKNLSVLESAAREIRTRSPEAILIVVTNPLDALTRAAIDLTGMPPHRVIGSGTHLDTMRLRDMLARHTGLDPRSIHGFVLGEHGDSELPAWSTVSIAGMTMDEYCRSCRKCDWQLPDRMRAAFDADVRRAAYRVIDMKGSTCYGIAMALERIVRCILSDERSIITVSSLLEGEYGIADVCLSLPCVISRRGIERRIPVYLTSEEELLLRRSADVVRATIPAKHFSNAQ